MSASCASPRTRAKSLLSLEQLYFVCCKAKHNPLENCIIFIASNKLRNKNAFVTWQRCTASSTPSLSFIWCQQQKIWSFQKNCHQCSPLPFPTALSFLFNVLATGFLCFSSPVPASHYKYDEHTAAANPPSLPFDRTSPSSFICHCRSSPLSLLDHTEGVQSDFVNHFFCSD